MTAVAFAILVAFGFGSEQSHRHHPADLSSALEAERRGHRAPHGIARGRARREGLPRRGARGASLRGRRAAAAGQRSKDADGDLGDEPVVHGAAGAGERADHVSGRPRMLAGTMTLGTFVTYGAFLGCWWRRSPRSSASARS